MRPTVTSHLTLDGVMQSNGMPEPELDDGFEQGGWQVPYFDEDLDRLTADWIAAASAILLGRRTHELFAKYWSRVTDPGDPRATQLNALPKYVVSTTLDRVPWNNSILVRGDVAEHVAQLERQPGNELQVHGSAEPVRTLMSMAWSMSTACWSILSSRATAGAFRSGTTPAALELIGTKTTSRGVAHIYYPAGSRITSRSASRQEGDVVTDPLRRRAGR